MRNLVTGNLLNETRGILVHGVNCQGKMGKGIALEIRKRYPQVFDSYLEFGNKVFWKPSLLLGGVDFVSITPDLIVVNAFTQEDYGSDGRRYVDYDAIDRCFSQIKQCALRTGLPVKYPRIGSGLAGGDWNIISVIIDANLSPNIDQTLFVM